MFTLEDILAIRGNRPVYQRLRELLHERQAIAFAGAGVSAPLFPLWPELLKLLAHAPVERGLASTKDEEYWLRTAGKQPLQVASQIRERLTDQHYYPLLHDTFKGRLPYFTPAHDALIRCNFKAWITTNYDEGLVEARRKRRPALHDTGYAIWNQTAEIERWLSGDRFGPESYPILFAHGHFANKTSIVLDHESYRRAYRTQVYRRFYENLWIQEHLVFAGFGFNDVTLGAIADEILRQINPSGPPRHIALLALGEAYNNGMRRVYLDTFHSEVLFYPVRNNDHSALTVLLESLASPPTAPARLATPAKSRVKARECFVHETTEDEKFTGRSDMLERLDAWASDLHVRLVAISALGGLGKTSLLGNWLRKGAHGRENVFFWSFYQDQQTARMVDAFGEFAREGGTFVIALDGLEVIQESPGTVGYGKLLDPTLAEVLHRHCRANDQNLLLLTSRFPFPDLNPYLGRGMRYLPLASLSDTDGAALLRALGVGGSIEDRIKVSDQLDGHPLALRIFARSMPLECGGDPTRVWRLIFGGGENNFDQKMRRLFRFYEQRLPVAHSMALSFLGLFRSPVGLETLQPLWDKLTYNPAPLGQTLDSLHREHLLTDDLGPRGQRRYSCHPILRDHFRDSLMGVVGVAPRVARLLNEGWARYTVISFGEDPDAVRAEGIMLMTAAVELLLDGGNMRAAHDLVESRFMTRGQHLYSATFESVFDKIPAPHWGMEVHRWFVRDEARRQSLETELGVQVLAGYLAKVGRYAHLAGEPETALRYYAAAEKPCRQTADVQLSSHLKRLAGVETSLGHLAEAVAHAKEALELAIAAKSDDTSDCYAYLAFAATIRGDMETASKFFAGAKCAEISRRNLYSLRGIYLAEYLIRTGETGRARELTLDNQATCRYYQWPDDVAGCDWLLGWLDADGRDWSSAHHHLDQAEAIFTRGHLIEWLGHVHLTRAACLFREAHFDLALAVCERTLDIAAPRNYRLIHADGLVLRARIGFALEDAAAARNDAESALQIAETCGYAWAERDACEILAQAWDALGKNAEATRYAARVSDIVRRLTVTE